jgi:signal transduction histidine kinase/CheY-like chemotaxis protein
MTTSAIPRTKRQSLWIGLLDIFSTWSCRRIHSGVVLLLFGLAICFGAIASAQAPTAVLLDSNRNSIDLWSNLTILSDPHNTFTIDDVLTKEDQFQAPLSSPHANLGPRKNATWLRTDIALSENAPVDWWLSIDFIFNDEIDLYVVEQGRVVQHQTILKRQAFAQRASPFHQPAFQLALQSGQQYQLIIRIRKYFPNAMYIPVSLDRTSSLIRDEASTQFWRSLMFGISTCFVMYALFTAALKRDLLCLWFALFAACSAVYASAYYGLANQHLWPNSSFLEANIIARYCMLIRAVGGFLFVDGVLDLRERNPRMSLLLKSLAGFFALLTFLFAADLVSKNLVAWAFSIAGTFPLLLLVPFVVRRVQDGDPLWDWAIAGAACYAIGMAVGTALAYGFLPWSRWTESAEHLGALLNMATWVVVMSIRTHRRQRAAEMTAESERQVVAQLAVDLKHQKEIAEETSLSKSRFLAAASHDLRQPVHALSLFIGALRSVPMNEKGHRLVDQIEASTDAMDRLFATLLDISKLDAGIVEVLRQPFAIDAVLSRVCDDYAAEAAAKGLTLAYVRCRATVNSDPTLFERIARNLISNAVRYTDVGRIVIGCRRRGSSVVMQVWDTGRGIPPDQQKLVFQEYYQVDNPERDREKGLGLGLAIVQRLAHLLQCDLRLRSERGRGSCFEISLPRASEAVMPLSEPVDKMFATSSTGLVVVIDDEKAIREGMSALLTDWGYEVLATGSANEAIRLLADYTTTPDLLICDLRLRDGENGIEAIERLRTEYNEHIPAMLITGDTASNRLSEAQTSELPVLHKPVPSGKLRATINQLIVTGAIQQKSNTEI